jgi:hypothetical protein
LPSRAARRQLKNQPERSDLLYCLVGQLLNRTVAIYSYQLLEQ